TPVVGASGVDTCSSSLVPPAVSVASSTTGPPRVRMAGLRCSGGGSTIVAGALELVGWRVALGSEQAASARLERPVNEASVVSMGTSQRRPTIADLSPRTFGQPWPALDLEQVLADALGRGAV